MHGETHGRCDNLSWRGSENARRAAGGAGTATARPHVYGGNGPHLATMTLSHSGFHRTREQGAGSGGVAGGGARGRLVGRVLGTELTVFEFLLVLGAVGAAYTGARVTRALVVRALRVVVRR